MINKEMLNERITELQNSLGKLKEQKESLQKQLDDVNYNIKLHSGAIEDCKYWVQRVEKEEQTNKKESKNLKKEK